MFLKKKTLPRGISGRIQQCEEISGIFFERTHGGFSRRVHGGISGFVNGGNSRENFVEIHGTIFEMIHARILKRIHEKIVDGFCDACRKFGSNPWKILCRSS